LVMTIRLAKIADDGLCTASVHCVKIRTSLWVAKPLPDALAAALPGEREDGEKRPDPPMNGLWS
jgi:hypothetical protein